VRIWASLFSFRLWGIRCAFPAAISPSTRIEIHLWKKWWISSRGGAEGCQPYEQPA